MRRTIAKRLAESKASIPHAYAVAECQVDRLLALRAQLKQGGAVVSVNDLVIKAAALALRSVPGVNAIWREGEAQLLGTVDVSVAVATDSGLITPIVKDAAGLDVTQISSTLKVRGSGMWWRMSAGGALMVEFTWPNLQYSAPCDSKSLAFRAPEMHSLTCTFSCPDYWSKNCEARSASTLLYTIKGGCNLN